MARAGRRTVSTELGNKVGVQASIREGQWENHGPGPSQKHQIGKAMREPRGKADVQVVKLVEAMGEPRASASVDVMSESSLKNKRWKQPKK